MQGDLSELVVSREFHAGNLPILISSKVLRRLGCGQVDLARLEIPRCDRAKADSITLVQELKEKDKEKSGWRVRLLEVKSSKGVSREQRKRLMASVHVISCYLNLPVVLETKVLSSGRGSDFTDPAASSRYLPKQ
ncbi:MAG: hypothetical protein HQK52_07885 [Oligoflexia bacterium]|nr:hypothetical protein [Oligoflexia bacterium]